MGKNTKGKISYVLQAINIVPLLVFSAVIMLTGTYWFTQTMYDEIEVELCNSANTTVTLLDIAHPGDYRLEGESAYLLYKGEHNITREYNLIDKIKEDTDLDVTLFYQDTRILTTLRNSSGQRIVGTGAPDIIIEEVLHTGKGQFYHNVLISGKSYFAYYMPLFNSDNTVAGMLFVGKPSSQVELAVQHSVYPLVIANIFAMLVTTICIFFYTRSFTSVLMKIHHFLGNISNGNLDAVLETSIAKRNDELGDIGRSALTMQKSLRKMVEQDPLTKLYNRRSADRKLQQTVQKSIQQNTPFCVAIGDIDFFKAINDTYGHDCGDKVLQNIAKTLQTHMHSRGFVARWGGEEFLLVFDNIGPEEAFTILEQLLSDIRAMESQYDDQIIKATMTFGLVAGNTEDTQQLLLEADEKLYAGKASGRNRIIL